MSFRILALALFLGSVTSLNAQQYGVTGRIPLSGDEGWDYLTADASNHQLYVSHGTEVQVVDLDSAKQVGNIGGMKRIHGIALADELNKGFITDGGDNMVVVFDLKSNAVTQKIRAGENPDSVLYEPTKKCVYAFNGRSNSATVIDATAGTVVVTIPLSGKPEFAVTDGKGNVYVNIETKNSLVRLDAEGTKKDEWQLPSCEEPSGLAMDVAGRRLFSVCSNKTMAVTDADSGKQVAKVVIGEGPDAAAYDPETKLVFSSNSDGTLTVVKQESPDKYMVVQNAQTEKRARTMALDRRTHKIYLSCAEFGPAPAPTTDNPHPRPKPKPGTFHLIVVAPEKSF
ncbi:MAG TPA: YncE family protein [Terriglobales bacterium]|nr:YncE family protein [Terriglobales bacterium]